MNKELLKEHLRVVPDYPVKGIMFFDVTTLFKNSECLKEIVDGICDIYKGKGITKVAGIESRGFISAAAVAHRLGAGFVPIRKPGKLPAETVSESYAKEYGTDSIELHTDSINEDDVVLIHDDILATGGTASAAVSLVQKFHPKAVFVNFIIDITDVPRTRPIPAEVPVSALLQLSEN